MAARSVVVATGPFQVPFVPALAAGFGDGVTQVHSSAYRNAEELPPGPVLVVGGGNSGFQLAAELAGTRTVHLSIGRRNACVLGRPWQRTAGSALLGFVGRDAARLAVRLQR